MPQALPEVIETIDRYMQAQEFARALQLLKKQIPLHPDDYSLKYRYLQISTIYLQNFLKYPEVALQIVASMPYYAVFEREDFDHPELKAAINEICGLLLQVEAKDKREFWKQLFEPFSKWLTHDAFLQAKDNIEARKFAAIRHLLKNLLSRTTIDQSGMWMYMIGLAWLTERDIQGEDKTTLSLAHHCLQKYIGYLNHEFYRLTSLEDTQQIKIIGEECISLAEQIKKYYAMNPIPAYASHLTTVRYNLIRMIPDHFSKAEFKKLNWEIIAKMKSELHPVIEKRKNLNAYAASHRLLRCLENVEEYELVLGALCYEAMENADTFRPLGYKPLLRFVRCSLANNKGYLAKYEVEYTLENKNLAKEDEEIQRQINEIIHAEWYQNAASFDITNIKLEMASCFLIFMNQ